MGRLARRDAAGFVGSQYQLFDEHDNGNGSGGFAEFAGFIVRTSTSDAAGRVISVVENPFGTTPYPYTTTYQYDAGQPHDGDAGSQTPRTFTYDSLSHMVKAMNPENGTVCYGQYIISVCTASMTATAIFLPHRSAQRSHRIFLRCAQPPAAISYSDGTPAVVYAWDSGAPYSKGRLTQVATFANVIDSITGYDAAGNIVSSSQQTGGNTYTFGYA